MPPEGTLYAYNHPSRSNSANPLHGAASISRRRYIIVPVGYAGMHGHSLPPSLPAGINYLSHIRGVAVFSGASGKALKMTVVITILFYVLLQGTVSFNVIEHRLIVYAETSAETGERGSETLAGYKFLDKFRLNRGLNYH